MNRIITAAIALAALAIPATAEASSCGRYVLLLQQHAVAIQIGGDKLGHYGDYMNSFGDNPTEAGLPTAKATVHEAKATARATLREVDRSMVTLQRARNIGCVSQAQVNMMKGKATRTRAALRKVINIQFP